MDSSNDYVDEVVLRTAGVGLKGNFEYERVLNEKDLLLSAPSTSSAFTMASVDDYEGDDDEDAPEDLIKTSFVRRVSACQARKTLGYYFAVCSSRLNLSAIMDLTPNYFEVNEEYSPMRKQSRYVRPAGNGALWPHRSVWVVIARPGHF